MRTIGWKTIDLQKTDLYLDKTANGSKISYIALDWQLDCGTVDGVNKSCIVMVRFKKRPQESQTD